MQKYEVRFSANFRDSLFSLYDYIVQQYNDPVNARKLVEKIERRCRRLAVFPKGYAVKIVKSDLGYRFVHVNRFTIAFTINEKQKTVAVRGLFCPGQDVWMKLLDGDL